MKLMLISLLLIPPPAIESFYATTADGAFCWYEAPEVCWTARLTVQASAGTYRLWLDYDPAHPEATRGSEWQGIYPVIMQGPLVLTNGLNILSLPVPALAAGKQPNPNGWFRLEAL